MIPVFLIHFIGKSGNSRHFFFLKKNPKNSARTNTFYMSKVNPKIISGKTKFYFDVYKVFFKAFFKALIKYNTSWG